jgi:hypothetical protein
LLETEALAFVDIGPDRKWRDEAVFDTTQISAWRWHSLYASCNDTWFCDRAIKEIRDVALRSFVSNSVRVLPRTNGKFTQIALERRSYGGVLVHSTEE